MKLFLRGALALGFSAALASTALSDTPPPPIAPTNKTPATAQSAADCAPTTGTVVSSGRGKLFGGRLFGGRIGSGGGFSGSHGAGLSARLDSASARIDEMMQKGEERQARFNEFLKHLAGPPVEAQAQPAGPRAPKATTQPGTVVFPQHPFVRSPRDFFMVD